MLCFAKRISGSCVPQLSPPSGVGAGCCKWVTASPAAVPRSSLSLTETLLRLIQGEIMGPATPNPLKSLGTARRVGQSAKRAARDSIRPSNGL